MKLIASDLDGTLLLNGNTQVSDELFRLIDAYQKQGVLFCAASGRQYNSLRGLFSPWRTIFSICVKTVRLFFTRGRFSENLHSREDALSICRSILARPHCEVLISGEQTSHLLPKQDDYVDHIRYFVGNHVTLVPSLDAIEEDILKVSAFCRNGAAENEEALGNAWKGRLNVAVSGRQWLDFTVAGKEDGLRSFEKRFPFSLRIWSASAITSTIWACCATLAVPMPCAQPQKRCAKHLTLCATGWKKP